MLQYRQTNLPALLIRFNERVWPDSSYQELGTEQRQADMLQYLQTYKNPGESQSVLLEQGWKVTLFGIYWCVEISLFLFTKQNI